MGGTIPAATPPPDMPARSGGAIVGSAIVKLCAEHGADCVPYVKEYVKSMKDAVMEA